MGGKTKIEWTRGEDGVEGATWNPIVADVPEGATRVDRDGIVQPDHSRWTCVMASEECTRCYASDLNIRFGGAAFAPIGSPEPPHPVKLNEKLLKQAIAWEQHAPRTIFVGSMTDVFGAWVPRWMQYEIFNTAYRAQRHTYQFLTKRPEIMRDVVLAWMHDAGVKELPQGWWFGTSIGFRGVDWRWRPLAEIPCRIHFISAEPLIGPLSLKDALGLKISDDGRRWERSGRPPVIEWGIVGGESGAKARTMDLVWARALVLQFQAAGVHVFVKQLGRHAGHALGDPDKKGGTIETWPEELRVREIPPRPVYEPMLV